MAIRSNDARRASTQNQSDPADPNCYGISDLSEATPQGGHRNASQSSSPFNADSINHKSTKGPRRRARRWLSCALSAGALGLFLSSVPGCTTTSGMVGAIGDGHCIDEFMIGYRNRALAEKAWHCQKNQFCNQQHSKEFKDGFMDGFMEVAVGGNGCVPAIAPKQYWGWRYQSAQGQGAVNSWFQGYPMGVRAAEQAGVGNWGQVQTASYHNQTPQSAPPLGGANPFYGTPAPIGQGFGDGGIQEPTGSPALQAPMMDSGLGPVDAGPSGAIEDVIDLNFDSASTDTSPQESGFGDEPVFNDGSRVSAAREARIAGLEDSEQSNGVSIDVDEVFGSAEQANSGGGNSLPFSFE